MTSLPDEPGTYQTTAREGVWHSLTDCLMPPDDSGRWLDLQRHQPDGVIVIRRFKGVVAAVTWAWSELGIEPADWRRVDEIE